MEGKQCEHCYDNFQPPIGDRMKKKNYMAPSVFYRNKNFKCQKIHSFEKYF